MLADKLILNLDCVKLQEKHLLPSYSGIYYVIDAQQSIWYIGRSVDLQNRWNSVRGHHRYNQLLSISSKESIDFFIHYSQEKKNRLNKIEKAQIEKYQPILNYTRVLKKGFDTRKKVLNRVFSESTDNYINTSLKILSVNKITHFQHPDTNKTSKHMENALDNNFDAIDSLSKFRRKFIPLRNNEIGLNFEMEVCVDSQQRYFVRHYTFFAFYSNSVSIADLKEDDIAKGWLSTLESRCKCLYDQSLRWLGYKLSCKNIVLVDEEEHFEIETTEIMLPFRMFIELVEYDWMRNSSLPEILEKKELSWFKNQSLSIKVAKHLHDNDLTLYKILEQIEMD